MELVPIKVRIGLNSKRQHDYPNFNLVSSEVRKGMDWSNYIDAFGTGWHYDKVCGHRETDEGNDQVPMGHRHRNTEVGVQFGVMCVPEDFALEAESLFPNAVEILDEDELQSFYEERCTVFEPDEEIDKDVVDHLMMKQKLEDAGLLPAPTEAEKASRRRMLDKEQNVPGIRKNKRKRWADFKASRGVTIKNVKKTR